MEDAYSQTNTDSWERAITKTFTSYVKNPARIYKIPKKTETAKTENQPVSSEKNKGAGRSGLHVQEHCPPEDNQNDQQSETKKPPSEKIKGKTDFTWFVISPKQGGLRFTSQPSRPMTTSKTTRIDRYLRGRGLAALWWWWWLCIVRDLSGTTRKNEMGMGAKGRFNQIVPLTQRGL